MGFRVLVLLFVSLVGGWVVGSFSFFFWELRIVGLLGGFGGIRGGKYYE